MPEYDERGTPEDGVALCLSGGGYRAMLFHVGSLWRLAELGALQKVDRVSSVSGGSITAARLALSWDEIFAAPASPADIAARYESLVVAPMRALAGQTIDASAIIGGLFSFGRVAERVEAAYRDFFGPTTLQDLPDSPRFIFCATNVQSGALWRFSKPYMGDYRVGRVHAPTLPIAQAVAASSAFPPFLSPTVLTLDPADVQADPGSDLSTPPYTQNIVLSDGGVYDNLGLEPAWKRCKTLLVSNAGGRFQPEPDPAEDWTRHSIRVAGIVDSQVRALRTRMLLDAYRTGTRKGAYWGIRTDIADYPLADGLDCPQWKTQELADEETRLAKMPDDLIDRLINWGYAVCDAGYRSYVHDDPAAPKAAFPYPASGVG